MKNPSSTISKKGCKVFFLQNKFREDEVKHDVDRWRLYENNKKTIWKCSSHLAFKGCHTRIPERSACMCKYDIGIPDSPKQQMLLDAITSFFGKYKVLKAHTWLDNKYNLFHQWLHAFCAGDQFRRDKSILSQINDPIFLSLKLVKLLYQSSMLIHPSLVAFLKKLAFGKIVLKGKPN